MEYAVHDPRSNYLMRRPFWERRIKHYSNSHKILLVGEGDFSFSLALANVFGSAENMVPTSLDSKEKLLQLYESAHKTLSNLETLGAKLFHGVDATKMEKHLIIRRMRFHRIVYNFPHAGFYGKENDIKVIEKHRHLLKMFFKSARTKLSEDGEIHVTHKENGPYEKWELVKQAAECGLLLKESVHFTIEDYPGYVNRRGAPPRAGDTFFLGDCRTYKFAVGPDIFYEWESFAIRVKSPNVSSEASAEDFTGATWEPETERDLQMGWDWGPEQAERQMRMGWEWDPEQDWEPEIERELKIGWDGESGQTKRKKRTGWNCEPEPERQMRMGWGWEPERKMKMGWDWEAEQAERRMRMKMGWDWEAERRMRMGWEWDPEQDWEPETERGLKIGWDGEPEPERQMRMGSDWEPEQAERRG